MNTDGPTDHSGMRVMTIDECLAHLATSVIGRVAFARDGEVVILPVHHIVRGTDICFRTSGSSKLQVAADHSPVGFEVDSHDDETCTGWSVSVTGVASIVDDDDVVSELDAMHGRGWQVGDGTSQVWVRIRPTAITGRELTEN